MSAPVQPDSPSTPAATPAPAKTVPAVAPAFAHLPASPAGAGANIKSAFETFKANQAAANAAAVAGGAAGSPAVPPNAASSSDDATLASTAPRGGADSTTPTTPTPPVDVITEGDGMPDPAVPVDDPPADPDATADDADGEGEPVVDDAASTELDPNDPLYVELPAATPNGEPIKLLAPDPETKAAIARLQNGYARGEELRAIREQKEASDTEFAEFETSLRTDPIGVVMDAMTTQQGIALARQLLTLEPVLRALESDGVSVADPDALERMGLRAEADRAKTRHAAQQALAAEREVRQNAKDLHAMLGRLMPDGLSPEQERLFMRDARGDLVAYQQETRTRTIPPQSVPQILKDRLAVYGVDAAERLRRADASRGQGRATPAAAKAPAGAQAATPPATRTFARVKATQAAKQLVAATAPGAASGSAPGGRLAGHISPDATIQEAVAQARELLRAKA